MSKEHPKPWTFHAVDACEDQPILDANGNEVLVRDSGVYPPDLDTCREIVDAVNGYEDANHEILRLIIEKDELRDLCVLLFDAVKHGNQVVDLPGIWNKAEEVLKRTDPEKKQ